MSDTSFDLVAHAKTAARDALNILEGPDEDILPVILSWGRRGLGIMGAAMPPDDEGKDDLADMITARISVAQADEAVMVCTAYLTKLDVNTGRKLSRQETIILVHVTPRGQTAWTAEVTRHANRPPDMSIWEEIPTGAVAGRFAEALSDGLAFARTVDADMQQILDKGYEEDRVDELVDLFLSAKAILDVQNRTRHDPT